MKQYLMVLVFGMICLIRATNCQDEQRIDEIINAVLACRNNPGLSVTVVKDGRVVLSKGYGVRNLQTGEPATNKTLFGLASLTKAFTSTLLVKQLSEKTSYHVGTNVYKVLNNSRLFNNTLRSIYATVDDLMAHRLAIPRNNFLRLSSTLTRENLVSRIRYLPSTGAFRKTFYYSDLMYGVLTRITENIGGQSWEDLMTSYILNPLGMTSTTFETRQDHGSSDVATPYVSENGVLTPASQDFIRHWELIGGSGSMMSTAEDMAKWLIFQLNNGKTPNGTQLMDLQDFEDTHRPRNMISSKYSATGKYFTRPKIPVTTSNDGYALGWKTGFYRGLRMLQHSGTTWGFASLLTLIPDENLGIFTSMSGTDIGYFTRLTLHNFLADIFLGETPWLNSTTICSFPRPWHNNVQSRRTKRAITMPISPFLVTNLVIYAGVYRNEAYGNIDVVITNNRLRAIYGIGEWNLNPTSDTKFTAVWQKDAPRLDFVFTFKKTGTRVYSLIPGFQKSKPPIFYKISQTPGLIG
ncbi:protein flp [Patella vulgata]|uniref:protein flp n=1 Tax=Patella vulgata TaxID=6465 RepID=UPI0021800DDB|nr:protein flp [Patella vulgata]